MSADPEPLPAGNWWTQAACAGRASLMFADDAFSQRLAVAVCRRCPVRPQCLAEVQATETVPRFGVVAGLTPAERNRWGDPQGS